MIPLPKAPKNNAVLILLILYVLLSEILELLRYILYLLYLLIKAVLKLVVGDKKQNERNVLRFLIGVQDKIDKVMFNFFDYKEKNQYEELNYNADLFEAIQSHDDKLVIFLVNKRHCNPNSQLQNGQYPIHLAIYLSENVCAMLAALSSSEINPLNLNAQDKEGNTAMHIASTFTKKNAILFLMEHNADLNIQNVKGNTPLHIACIINAKEIARILLKDTRTDKFIKNNEGYAPNHYNDIELYDAVQFHDDTLVTSLVSSNHSNPNNRLPNGQFPVHLAATLNDNACAVLKALSSSDMHPLDFNAQDNEGNTAMHIATNFAKVDVVSFFMERKVDVNIQNKNGNTPLHIACITNATEIARMLLKDIGIDKFIKNNEGYTPNHYNDFELFDAVQFHDDTLVTSLVSSNHSNPNNRLPSGQFPVHLAATLSENTCAVLKALSSSDMHPLDLNVQDNEGNTAMHIATNFAKVDVVSFFMERKVDINIQNTNGNTPLHIACRNNIVNIAEMILNDPSTDISIKNNEGLAPNQLDLSLNIHAVITRACLNRKKAALGELEIALSWNNFNDLDIHVICPHGQEICYTNRISTCCSGMLDIDMNAGEPRSEQPVEHIYWNANPPDGNYVIMVNLFARHTTPPVISNKFYVEISVNSMVVWEKAGTISFDHGKLTVISFKYPEDIKWDFNSSCKRILCSDSATTRNETTTNEIVENLIDRCAAIE